MKISRIAKLIMNHLGLRYDAEFWAISLPGDEAKAEEPKPKPSRRRKPEPQGDIVHTPMGAMRYSRPKKEQMDWDPIEGGNERSANLTEADENALMIAGIDLTERAIAKASAIKRLWAQGKTNSQIVHHFRDKKGYGERTIKTYTACFGRAVQNGANIS
jgi:hypothetical protein